MENRELEILKMYLEEVKAVSPAKEGERERILKEYRSGSAEAKDRLIKLYLADTLQIASEYKSRGVPLSDLIQEANMGLLMALQDGEAEDISIKRRIRESVEELLDIEGRAEDVGEHLAEQLNRLDEASKALAEENGQAPSVEELSEYLGITEEELKEYMKISLDAVNADVQK